MKEFLNYQYMITPGVLKILSYVAIAVCVIAGIFTLFVEPISGIGMIVLGPIVSPNIYRANAGYLRDTQRT